MSFRIFITGSGIVEEAQRLIQDEGGLWAAGDPKDTPEEIAEKLRRFGPDGLIVRQGRITADALEAAPNLRVICKHGVGTENIDLEAAARRGIPVLYTPSANAESVAEHALALILALLRRIPYEDGRVRRGVFDKQRYEGLELSGKTLGIIGYGRTGRRLAELAGPFKAIILAYDPWLTPGPMPTGVARVQDVQAVFSRADIISLHCPLTADTRGMLNQAAFAQMKEGVYLVNTARGGIINESDLCQALRERRIRGAALDVFENEPPDRNHPLFQFENVILTPHVAGSSDQSLRNMGLEAVGNVLALLRGRAPSEGSCVACGPGTKAPA